MSTFFLSPRKEAKTCLTVIAVSNFYVRYYARHFLSMSLCYLYLVLDLLRRIALSLSVASKGWLFGFTENQKELLSKLIVFPIYVFSIVHK
jgi:hypothetical protein